MLTSSLCTTAIRTSLRTGRVSSSNAPFPPLPLPFSQAAHFFFNSHLPSHHHHHHHRRRAVAWCTGAPGRAGLVILRSELDALRRELLAAIHTEMQQLRADLMRAIQQQCQPRP